MYLIQSLGGLLNNFNEDYLKSSFNNFETKKDTDISYFLKYLSIEYEKKDITRTFLIYDANNKGCLLGYFTIGLNILKLQENLKIPDAYSGVHLYEKGYHPIYKLFMIGKNDNALKKLSIKSEIFEKEVMGRFLELKKDIGTNLVYLDCTKELVPYYKNLGFTFFDYDDKSKLYNLIYKMV